MKGSTENICHYLEAYKENIMIPNDMTARLDAVNPNNSVCVNAGAGSGKTSLLLERYLNCLSIANKPEEVLAITFTNKAVNEILERVHTAFKSTNDPVPNDEYHKKIYFSAKKVIERSNLLGWNVEKNLTRLKIMTFDTYSASISKRLPMLSGFVSGNVDENPSYLYEKAVVETFLLMDSTGTSVPDEVKESLKNVLYACRNRLDVATPLFVDLLMKREQWVGNMMEFDEHENIRVIGRMIEDVLMKSFLHVKETIPSEDLRQIVSFSNNNEKLSLLSGIPLNRNIEIQDVPSIQALVNLYITKAGLIRSKVTSREGFPPKEEHTTWFKDHFQHVKDHHSIDNFISACKEIALLPPSIDILVQYSKDISIVLRYLFATLKVIFSKEGKVDFPEISLRAISALQEDSDTNSTLMVDEYSINHILVDEMQDTSRLQIHLLSLLCQEWNEDKSLFLCGDAMQSIYWFRGAVPEYFTNILESEKFGDIRLKKLLLTENFRSSPVLVNWVNTTMSDLLSKSDISHLFTKSTAFNSFDGRVDINVWSDDEQEVEILTNKISIGRLLDLANKISPLVEKLMPDFLIKSAL